MLQRLREHLTLALFLFLPFHALFVTSGTKVLLGAGQPPLLYLAVWKELLLIVIFLMGIVELFLKEEKTIVKIVQSGARWTWRFEQEQFFVLFLLLLAVLLLPGNNDLETFLYGFKYLLLPLIFFLVLRGLPWEAHFLERRVFPVLLVVGGGAAAYGILSFFLPTSFFLSLGYSDAHSLYSPHTPLSAFQLISGTGIRRVQSTFAGPNQLGMWLLLPWSISLVRLLRKEVSRFSFLIFGLVGIAILLTFSRAAWIAAFVITLTACCMVLRGPRRETVLITLVTVTCVVLALLAYVSPQLFLRGISNQHHLERLRSSIMAVLTQPLGRGLGAAGPASNRLKDACVYFPDGADTSWARARKDLCIFVGNAQVQPLLTERKCQCAFLPENWYLQVGIELGVLGLVLFVALVIFVLRSLLLQPITYNLQPFLAFLGISIAGLFLHSFEDSAVAYTVWGIAGIALATASSHSWIGRLRSCCLRLWKCR